MAKKTYKNIFHTTHFYNDINVMVIIADRGFGREMFITKKVKEKHGNKEVLQWITHYVFIS